MFVCIASHIQYVVLTLGAVLPLPSGIADDLSALPAGEMTESVISGAAENRASFSVVVLITDEPVGELEFGSSRVVQVLSPVLSHRQVSLRGHGADDALWILCSFAMQKT